MISPNDQSFTRCTLGCVTFFKLQFFFKIKINTLILFYKKKRFCTIKIKEIDRFGWEESERIWGKNNEKKISRRDNFHWLTNLFLFRLVILIDDFGVTVDSEYNEPVYTRILVY
jgi:hypothetical protein